MSTGKTRVWTFLTYPDSLPSNFDEVIEEMHVPIVTSPIHDKDIAPEGKGWNNTPYKKPHYHNMIMFQGVKSSKQVSELVKKLGASHVEHVHSTQAMIRYFIHLDHKDKAQYKKEDIKAFNGADIESILEKNDREINGILKQMINIIDNNDISEFSQMVRLCMTDEYFNDYFPLISGKYQFFILNYIKSKHFKNR
jgi:hypothetical protein